MGAAGAEGAADSAKGSSSAAGASSAGSAKGSYYIIPLNNEILLPVARQVQNPENLRAVSKSNYYSTTRMFLSSF